MYASWADSVLLWAVIEIKGFVVVLGGTGGGVFLYVVMQDDTGKRKKDSDLHFSFHI